MSSGQTPRTPVHFPRMKVRGKRNRRRAAGEGVRRRSGPGYEYFPSVVIGFDSADPDTGSLAYTARSAPPGTPGAHAMFITYAPKDTPAPVAAPVAGGGWSNLGQSFSMNINFTNLEISDDTLDLFFGRTARQGMVH